jgi:hypothetical protein
MFISRAGLMKVIAEAGTLSGPALVNQVSASLRVSHLIYRRSADVENPVPFKVNKKGN